MPPVLLNDSWLLIGAAVVLVLFGNTILAAARWLYGVLSRIHLHAPAAPAATPAAAGDDYARGYRDGLDAANQAYAKAKG